MGDTLAILMLRALGRRAPPVEVAKPPAPPLRDRTGDALMHHLMERGLWGFGSQLELQRDGARLSVRVFLPEYGQSLRDVSALQAGAVRAALTESLGLEGYRVTFSDSLWCERGSRGWVVIAKGTEVMAKPEKTKVADLRVSGAGVVGSGSPCWVMTDFGMHPVPPEVERAWDEAARRKDGSYDMRTNTGRAGMAAERKLYSDIKRTFEEGNPHGE